MQTKAIWVLAGAVGAVGLGASAAFATVTAPLDSIVPAAPVAHSSLSSHSALLDLTTTDDVKVTLPATVPEPVAVAPAAPVEAAPVAAEPVAVAPVAVPDVVAPVAEPVADPAPEPAVKDPSKDCDHDGVADADKVAADKDKDNDGSTHRDGSHARNGHSNGWHGMTARHSNSRGGHK